MATPLFKKLNWKNQSPVWIIDAPESFSGEMDAMGGFTEIRAGIPNGTAGFILAFTPYRNDLDRISEAIKPCLGKETVLWFAYPKGTSKKYKCDFNRDKGWDIITAAGYQGVRMVSVDDDWSALRFSKK